MKHSPLISVKIPLLAALLIMTAVLAPVSADVLQANFTASPLTGPHPLNVQFNDTSAGLVTSWLWYFGDNTSTNLQHPLHQYTVPGNYTVTLTVANSTGSNTLEKPGYILVTNTPPVAGFTAAPLSGHIPLPVQFTDTSTGIVTTYLWDFGDGNTSSDSNPLHTYHTPGSYNVSLVVANDGGSNTTSAVHYITVTNVPPVASFSANTTAGVAPLPVLFTDESSGEDITSRAWTFGDGATSGDESPVHVYTTPGTYSVTLTVENDGGDNTTTRTNYIRVFNEVPIVDFMAVPTSGGEPLTVQFHDTSLGNPTTWQWQFGDGGISPLQSPSHTYQSPGNYTVTLTASTSGGTNTTTKVNYIQVLQRYPVADFSAVPDFGVTPLVVNFTDLSTGTPTSWAWDFGDGNTSNDQNPVHTYESAGIYTVNLTVSNSYGTDSIEVPECITAGEAPHADFNASETEIYTNQYVDFVDLSTGNPTSYLWDFGDGSNSTYPWAWHGYQEPGNYTVSLTVANEFGSDTETKTDYISVSPHPPEADFEGWPRDGSFPLTVTFYQWSYGGYFENLSYLWDFGDGTTSTSSDREVVHTYMEAGVYTVSLTVSANGLSDTVERTDYIGNWSPPPPVAGFTATPRDGVAPLAVSFIDQSTGSPPLSYAWDFGDGETSTDKNPVHTFAGEGTYNVSLTTTNAGGSSTETKEGYITVGGITPLKADFTSNITSGIAPLSVQFFDASEGNPSSWFWSFESGYYYVLNGAVETSALPYYPGQVSSEKNPVMVYESPGNYSISLTVSRTGESDTIEKVDYIQVSPPPPVASFYPYPSSGDAPLEVEFDGYIPWWYYYDEWVWDFGDGTTETKDYPWTTHTYTNPGLYNVTLTVNSQYGSNTTTTIDCINVTQPSVPPVPNFEGTPLSGNAPVNVAFTDTSTGIVTSRWWDFGDGTTVWSNESADIEHTYAFPGTYTVSLTAGNAAGQETSTKPGYIHVLPSGSPPIAFFTMRPMAGVAPLTVSFTDRSMGAPLAWMWDFGDGTTSTEQSPVHTYTGTGTYTVTLKVLNYGGSSSNSAYVWVRTASPVFTPATTPSGTASPTVTQTPAAPLVPGRAPISFFMMSKSIGFAPMTVQLTDMSFNAPVSWNWDFGDGGTSTIRNPSHTYTTPGTYTVTLTAENAAGSSTSSRKVYVR
ncbi:MAG: PKD domain protein [Methanoregulaceae archaeon PtaB.Bin056]|nr:MAG: PKD domain protein [Methanoregulaceae archaeon PtaB.Bin056]